MKNVLKAIFFPVYLVYVILDKVSYKMMMIDGDPRYGAVPAFPRCMSCGGKQYNVASKPTFTTNRFGQQRITAFVDCVACGMRYRALRSAGENWSFTEPS